MKASYCIRYGWHGSLAGREETVREIMAAASKVQEDWSILWLAELVLRGHLASYEDGRLP